MAGPARNGARDPTGPGADEDRDHSDQLDGQATAAVERRPARRTEWMRALRRSPFRKVTKHVLLEVGTYANADGTGAFPAEATLASDSGYSDRTVRRALEKGRATGWLDRWRRGHRLGDGTTRSSGYRLTIPVDIDTSTGHPCPVENGSQPVTRDAQPVTRDTSTGHPCPPRGSRERDQREGEGAAHAGEAGTSPAAPPPSSPRPDGAENDAGHELAERWRARCTRYSPGEVEDEVAIAATEYGPEVVALFLDGLDQADAEVPDSPPLRWRYPRDVTDELRNEAEELREHLAVEKRWQEMEERRVAEEAMRANLPTPEEAHRYAEEARRSLRSNRPAPALTDHSRSWLDEPETTHQEDHHR